MKEHLSLSWSWPSSSSYSFCTCTPPPSSPDPAPTPWPHQFHAGLLMDHMNYLVSLVNLWYDWPRGCILHEIRSPDTPSYDAQWNNGTSFFYTLASHACCSVEVGIGVGILRPDWLATGVAYLGRVPADGYGRSDRHVWTKADFVTYYEDVATGHPDKCIYKKRQRKT